MADTELDPQEERLIGRLIHSSGRGPQPPEGARERVYAAVRAEWERNVVREPAPAPRRRRLFGEGWLTAFMRPALAVAAVAVVAVGMAVFIRQPEVPGVVQVASIQKVVGTVTSTPAGAGGSASATAGMSLYSGQEISTGPDGGIALLLASGESVRLDRDTSVRLADGAIELETGAVYVDSEGNADVSSAMIIRSRFGSVRHVGTQYEARVQDAGIRVRVREGAVEIAADAGDVRGIAGEEIVVPDTGAIVRNRIGPTDAAWQWTEQLAALPEAPEYGLTEVLTWVARQTGRELRFGSGQSRTAADELVLRGLGGLSPAETLDVVTSTTTVALTVTADTLLIE